MTVLARRSSLLLVFALSCMAAALAIGVQQAHSAPYHTCHLTSRQKGSGAFSSLDPGGYLKSLKVKSGPTCAGARNFVKLYYRCRTKGAKPFNGRCSSLSGYRCHENRSNVIPTAFDAKATCSKGSRRIYISYSERLH